MSVFTQAIEMLDGIRIYQLDAFVSSSTHTNTNTKFQTRAKYNNRRTVRYEIFSNNM